MMTGDMHALIASAERARALGDVGRPGRRAARHRGDRRGQLALGDVEQGDALLSACEPYLIEADPLAIVEIVGDGRRTRRSGSRTSTARSGSSTALIAAARDASAVSALIYPLAARAHLDFRLGRWARRARRGRRVGRARPGHRPARRSSPTAWPRSRTSRRRSGARTTAGGTSRRAGARRALPGRRDRHVPARRARAARAGAGTDPGGDRGARGDASAAPTGCRCSRPSSSARPDLVEAYARAGRREEAAALADAFAGARAATTGSRVGGGAPRAPPARAARARRRGPRAAFDAALALHDGLPMPFERARTLLRFGERLRRARQRADAREPLKEALETFERLGARGWAERARTELRATGEQQRAGPRPRPSSSRRTSSRSPCSWPRA